MLVFSKNNYLSFLKKDVTIAQDLKQKLRPFHERYYRTLCLRINEHTFGRLNKISINKEMRSWKSMISYQDFSKVQKRYCEKEREKCFTKLLKVKQKSLQAQSCQKKFLIFQAFNSQPALLPQKKLGETSMIFTQWKTDAFDC